MSFQVLSPQPWVLNLVGNSNSLTFSPFHPHHKEMPGMSIGSGLQKRNYAQFPPLCETGSLFNTILCFILDSQILTMPPGTRISRGLKILETVAYIWRPSPMRTWGDSTRESPNITPHVPKHVYRWQTGQGSPFILTFRFFFWQGSLRDSFFLFLELFLWSLLFVLIFSCVVFTLVYFWSLWFVLLLCNVVFGFFWLFFFHFLCCLLFFVCFLLFIFRCLLFLVLWFFFHFDSLGIASKLWECRLQAAYPWWTAEIIGWFPHLQDSE